MSCITTSQCQQMSTAHVNYCKPPHMTIDDLENGVEWPYTTFFIPSRKGKIIEPDKKTIFSKLCYSNFTFTGNTSNMWNHLEEAHRQEFRQAQ